MIPALNYPLGNEPLIIGGYGRYMIRLNPLILNCFDVSQFLQFVTWFGETGDEEDLAVALQDIHVESCLRQALTKTTSHPRFDSSYSEHLFHLFEESSFGSIGNQVNDWQHMIEKLNLWPNLLKGDVYFVVSFLDGDGDFNLSNDSVASPDLLSDSTQAYHSGLDWIPSQIEDLTYSPQPIPGSGQSMIYPYPLYVPHWLIDEILPTPSWFPKSSWSNTYHPSFPEYG